MRLILCLLAACWLAAAAEPPFVRTEVWANLPAQAVGPNDLLGVTVYDGPEFSHTVRVGADGLIRLPMLKRRIKVDGLYPGDVESAIAAALREEGLLIDPFVTVTIVEYHSRPINVAGAVKMPLVFQAEGPTTLLEAISRAQGLRADAGREILVSRSQPGPDGQPVVLTRRISVRALIDQADPALNLQLTGGEEIRVPELSRIFVVGNVKKPGAFPVQDDGDTTVLQMIALAEGLAPYANKQAYVYRREGPGKKEIDIPLEKIMRRQVPDFTLAANDILYIPDNKGGRVSMNALEKILLFGSTAGATALTYGLVR